MQPGHHRVYSKAHESMWCCKGLRPEKEFPRSDVATLHITAAAHRVHAPAPLARLAIGKEANVDGQPLGAVSPSDLSKDIAIRRSWEGTAVVTVRLTAAVKAEALPDGSPRVSITYGPVVVASRCGAEGVPGFQALDERMGHFASSPILPLAQTPVVTGTRGTPSSSLIGSQSPPNWRPGSTATG